MNSKTAQHTSTLLGLQDCFIMPTTELGVRNIFILQCTLLILLTSFYYLHEMQIAMDIYSPFLSLDFSHFLILPFLLSLPHYDYFAECEIGVTVSERARIQSLGRSLSWSILPSLGRRLLFVFPLTNAQLDLTKRKMSSKGSANVKHSKIIMR